MKTRLNRNDLMVWCALRLMYTLIYIIPIWGFIAQPGLAHTYTSEITPEQGEHIPLSTVGGHLSGNLETHDNSGPSGTESPVGLNNANNNRSLYNGFVQSPNVRGYEEFKEADRGYEEFKDADQGRRYNTSRSRRELLDDEYYYSLSVLDREPRTWSWPPEGVSDGGSTVYTS